MIDVSLKPFASKQVLCHGSCVCTIKPRLSWRFKLTDTNSHAKTDSGTLAHAVIDAELLGETSMYLGFFHDISLS